VSKKKTREFLESVNAIDTTPRIVTKVDRVIVKCVCCDNQSAQRIQVLQQTLKKFGRSWRCKACGVKSGAKKRTLDGPAIPGISRKKAANRSIEDLERIRAVDCSSRIVRAADKIEVWCWDCEVERMEVVYNNQVHCLKKKGRGYRCPACAKAGQSEAAQRKTGSKNPFYGKKHSNETRKKLAEQAKERLAQVDPVIRRRIARKARAAAYEKYDGNPMHNPEVRERQKEATSTESFIRYAKERGFEIANSSNFAETMSSFSKEFWGSQQGDVQKKKNGTRLHKWLDENPDKAFSSKAELEILEWVESLGLKARKYRQGGQEIDIYIPELEVGIEYNGLYWHSEAQKAKDYHLNKTQHFQQHGIQIIHVFEHEWRDRQDQVKSFLRSKLGKNKHRIGARKVEFVELDKGTAKEMLYAAHIQGYTPQVIYSLGGYYQGELVLVATFGKHHRNKDQVVLNRFACRDGWTISGGLSKVSKIAAERYGTIISWCDLRWSSGKGYRTAGWIEEESLNPDYFYTDGRHVISKQSRQKKVANTPPFMTEREHALFDGLLRVHDCGKIRFKYKAK